MVCEVMGRHAGHIATWAGIAGGATLTLIPEEPFDIEEVCQAIKRRHAGGRYATIIVVAEGAVPAPGTIDIAEPGIDEYGHKRLGGIGNILASEIEERTGIETRVTMSLSHPNILQTYGMGFDRNRAPYLVMEFVEGESLAGRLPCDGPVPVAEGVEILRSIASALAYAHRRGIVHRDLKPENILCSMDGGVRSA